MKLSTTLLPVTSALLFASAASAQVMTEVRISTAGIDQEYVEILGTPGQATDGLMLLVVEGDPGGATGGAGNLDRVHDLAGQSFPVGDEYFVFGSVAASTAFGSSVIDYAPADDLFENSSLTLYLVSVPDANLRNDIATIWFNTDITDPVGSLTTRIATDPGVTILDAVGMWDNGPADLFFDNAPVFGPDPGGFLPSGIIRNGGCPGDWCTDTFVTFQITAAMAPFVDATPGAANPSTACMTIGSAGVCPAGGGNGTAYCTAVPNSTGATGVLSAAGSLVVANNDVTLTASSLPLTSFGFFIVSRDQGFVANPGGSTGNLCIIGNIGRYVGPGQIKNTGTTGSFSLALNLGAIPSPTGAVATVAGDTWEFQTWHRDTSGGSPTSNFTQGLEIMFQ